MRVSSQAVRLKALKRDFMRVLDTVPEIICKLPQCAEMTIDMSDITKSVTLRMANERNCSFETLRS